MKTMKGGTRMKRLVDVFKALSDETRLRMVNLLYERELCVCDVMAVLQIPQAKASRHLIYLKNAGVVKDRKQAQWAYYSLATGAQLQFLDRLLFDNLRKEAQYEQDLVQLGDWLAHKRAGVED